MTAPRLDDLAGFRRRIRIVPEPGAVAASVEDDFHCMTVTLRHDGSRITDVAARMARAPWTTCPGAETVVRDTFTGTLLQEAARRGLKQANCTHLYDLAVLAAAHALEDAPTDYQVLVGDPREGEILAELRRDGATVLEWTLQAMTLTAPADLAGTSIFELRGAIEAMDEAMREAAKILQWACLIAHGRQIPLEQQSDATKLPPNCYTFQPERARKAVRVGEIVDFSRSERRPLETL